MDQRELNHANASLTRIRSIEAREGTLVNLILSVAIRALLIANHLFRPGVATIFRGDQPRLS